MSRGRGYAIPIPSASGELRSHFFSCAYSCCEGYGSDGRLRSDPTGAKRGWAGAEQLEMLLVFSEVFRAGVLRDEREHFSAISEPVL